MQNLRPTVPVIQQNNMRSAIILGLGGTGLEIITMIRRMIVERYGSLNELPTIAFLHLDTATEQPSLTPTSILGDSIALKDVERVTLKMPQITDGGADYLAHRPMVREWFPPTLRIECDFSLGAGAVRAFGRLAFSENAHKIVQALGTAATKVNDPNNRNYVSKKWATVDDGVDIYVVCSLLGGTGSGTFLDAAYLARDIVSGINPQTQTLGFIVVGGGSALETPNLANSYGALKELVYYSTRAKQVEGTSQDAFSVKYPNNITVKSEAQRPFSFCYLVTNFNEANVQIKREELFETVAQNIFLEFTPGVAATKRSIRVNIASHNYTDLDQQLGQAQCFMTFGQATIEFPALRVQDCLAYRLAGETLDYWKFEDAKGDIGIPQQAKADLQAWGIDPENLLKSLITDETGRSLTKEVTDSKNRAAADLQKYTEISKRDDLSIHLKNFLDASRGDVRVTLDPSSRGAYIKQIEHRAEDVLSRVANELKRRIAEQVRNPYSGSRNAITYLETIENNLGIYKKGYVAAEDAQRRKTQTEGDNESKAFADMVRDKRDANNGEMLRHISVVLGWSEKYSTATILQFGNLRARLLLVGERDEQGRWTGNCLLKEIEQLKTQIKIFSEQLDHFRSEFVGTLEQEAEGGKKVWNGGKYRSLYSNLTTGAFNNEVLVDPNEIDDLYRASIRDERAEYLQLKDEVERRLGVDNTPLSIFLCVQEKPEKVKQILIEFCRKRFDEIRNISIAKKLCALPQEEVSQKIEQLFRRSHPLLRFDNSSLFGVTLKGDQNTHHNPGYHSIRKLATCPINDDPDVALTRTSSDRSKLAVAFQSELVNIDHETTLPDRYRLVFVQEKGVFPLYCAEDFKPLENAYFIQSRQSGAKPHETDHRIKFPNLFPADPREQAMPQRVEKAMMLGRAFGMIIEGTDVTTEEAAVLYVYQDQHYTRQEINLGRTWSEAVEELKRDQIEQEVYGRRTKETTTLELLEGALEAEGQKPIKVSDREKAWERLQSYLTQMAESLPGGDRNPEYVTARDYINQFRTTHGWNPPAGWKPPEDKNHSPNLDTGDRQSKPSVSTSTQSQSDPNDVTSIDREKFRRRVRLTVRKSGGHLSVEDVTRLMQEGGEDYNLSLSTAKGIIDSEQSSITEAGAPNLQLEKYKTICVELITDGTISPEAREVLDEKTHRYGLTSTQAQAIESQVLHEAQSTFSRKVD